MTQQTDTHTNKGKPLPASFVREQLLIRLLMSYIGTGLFFMLLPGTFLGVWNLFAISGGHSPTAVSTAWIQAHGHAQLLGWIGTFILGIGFYSIPNLRKVASQNFWEGWTVWALWTAGVACRWIADVYYWNWHVLLPLSGALEFAAAALFLIPFARGYHLEGQTKGQIPPWAVAVIWGSIGFFLSLMVNVYETFALGLHGTSPAFPAAVDSRWLFLATWAFPVPMAWGLTARWMPPLLGLKPLRERMFLTGLAADALGVLCGLMGLSLPSAVLLLAAAIMMPLALRLFEPTIKEAKTSGVHPSFPFFMRVPYVWLIAAAALELWSAIIHTSVGIGGASRHAMTVGFIATLVFTVAPRMLPAFMGRKGLFSSKLMVAGLSFLSLGCLIRVPSEVIAYRHYWHPAWSLLPISATFELIGVTLFAINMVATIKQPPLMPQMDLKKQKAVKRV